MNKLNFLTKQSGDPLEASEWNQVVSKIDEIVESENTGGTPVVIDPSGILSTSSKGNVTLGSTKNINLEPAWSNNVANYSGNLGDIALKPGDDILFCSHHREPKKRDKIVIKNIDGSDNPVKLLVVSGEIDLAVGTESNPKTATRKKDNNGADIVATPLFKADDAKVLDLRILTGNTLDKNELTEREERGYLKVRAQAIDLRCEKHGGIALLPKGYDSDGNMNKIKFEHGGGDGLEFGTFNAEKTSIFTDEYRFNKNGIWKMTTREKLASGKTIIDECETNLLSLGKVATGAYKYKKNNSANNSAKSTADGKTYEAADDFYDFIDTADELCTTNDIIKTAHAFNNSKNRHAKYEEKITTSGNLKKTLEIETVITITYEATNNTATSQIVIPEAVADVTKVYTISDFKDAIKVVSVNDVLQKYGTAGDEGVTLSAGDVVTIEGNNYTIVENFAPSIDITSNAELSIKGKENLKLGGGIVEFGSDTIDLGEMEDGLYAQYKLTKKNNSKPCDILKIKVINNTTNSLSFDSDSGAFSVDSFYPGSDGNHPAAVTVPAKVAEPTTDAEATQHILVVAQCKLYDVIKFVAWAKTTNFGPWAAPA